MARHKGYNKRKGGQRPNRQRDQRKIFHIICEGVNTEPDYFRAFPLNNAIIKSLGKGEQRIKLVESTIEYIQENEIKDEDNEEVWVIFDIDRKEDDMARVRQQYNSAIDLAKKHNIKCAVSNDSFELWYVLHFLFTDSEHRRDWYNNKLTEVLKVKYSKDKTVSKRMYELLKDKQEIAIKNAKKLNEIHHGKKPCDKNPFTSVYKLVEELNVYKR